jgi:hypothetical protein
MEAETYEPASRNPVPSHDPNGGENITLSDENLGGHLSRRECVVIGAAEDTPPAEAGVAPIKPHFTAPPILENDIGDTVEKRCGLCRELDDEVALIPAADASADRTEHIHKL